MKADLRRIVNEEWESKLMNTFVSIHSMAIDIGKYVNDLERGREKLDYSAFYSVIHDANKRIENFKETYDPCNEIDMRFYTQSLFNYVKAADNLRINPYISR